VLILTQFGDIKMSKGYVIEYKDEYGSGTGYSFKKFNTRLAILLCHR
jgi:putative component of toxin-antitoxin plasmid stabilization module